MLSHEDCMALVCGVCTRKAKNNTRSRHKKRGQMKPITDKILGWIRKHHHQNYIIGVYDCPGVICWSCSELLKATAEREVKWNKPNVDYSQMKVPRATGDICQCRWCQIGRMNGAQYLQHCKSVVNQRGRPRVQEPPSTDTVPICNFCNGVKAAGVPHVCNKTERNNNLVNLVREASPESQGRVVSQLLNGLCRDKNISQKTGQIVLPSGSNEKIINLGAPKPKPQWSINDMIEFGNDRNFSNRDLLAHARALRVKGGRDAVEPGLAEALTSMGDQLRDFFTWENETIPRLDKKTKGVVYDSVPHVYTTDIEALAHTIIDVREIAEDDEEIILSIDDGQQFLKVIFPAVLQSF